MAMSSTYMRNENSMWSASSYLTQSSPKLTKAHQSHPNSLHRRKKVSKRCLNPQAV